MEIKEKKINKNKYMFICEYWETYRAWGHKVTLFKNNYELQQAKARYYNRTWECYTFQSTILQAIRQEIEKQKEKIKSNYKYKNNIARMTKKHTEALQEEIKNNDNIKELQKLYKIAQNNNF